MFLITKCYFRYVIYYFYFIISRCYPSCCADPQRQWHCRTSSTNKGVLVEIHLWRRTQDIASGGFSPHAVARGALSRSWTQSCLFLSMFNIPSTQLTHAPSPLANGPALCLKGVLGQQNYCRVIPYLWPKFSFLSSLFFFKFDFEGNCLVVWSILVYAAFVLGCHVWQGNPLKPEVLCQQMKFTIDRHFAYQRIKESWFTQPLRDSTEG